MKLILEKLRELSLKTNDFFSPTKQKKSQKSSRFCSNYVANHDFFYKNVLYFMVSITKSTDITLHIILATLTKTLLKRKHFGSIFIRLLVKMHTYQRLCKIS